MLFAKKIEKYLDSKRGAIHVGAHIGGEANWYASQQFSPVIWFEPNFKLFPELQRNIAKYENNKAYNIGIHDILKKGILHVASNGGQSSSLLEFGLHKKYHSEVHYVEDQEVNLMRLDVFLNYAKIDIKDYNFLNVDVQGVELNVIKSLDKLIGQFDYIYTEVNEEEVYRGCSLIGDIDKYLSDYKFIRVATEMTPAKWGDAFYKRYGTV